MLAIQVTSTITLGSILIGSAVALAGLFGVSRGVKWRVAAEVSMSAADELRKALADEKTIAAAREHRLSLDLKTTTEELRVALATIAKLEALPDLARVVALIDAHEVRAQERHESVVLVLQALADRISSSSTVTTATVTEVTS